MKKALPFILIFFVLCADQYLKIWVKTHMMLEQEFPIISNWLYLHFAENRGMAFGFEFAGNYGKHLLNLIRIIAISGIGIFMVHVVRKHNDYLLASVLALLFAGALGNMIDSAFYGLIFTDSFGQYAQLVPPGQGYASFMQGSVVDMFYIELLNFHLPDWFPVWPMRHVIFFRPVFNIADMAIFTGIISLLTFKRKAFRAALDW
ncbi:MAG: lipoprotein signal peptidase [Salinivirgaceae bacterium]